jgi:hypothetical protein
VSEPLNVSYDAEGDVLTVSGVKYSGDFFRAFCEPDRQKFYSFVRTGDTIDVTEFLRKDFVELVFASRGVVKAAGRPGLDQVVTALDVLRTRLQPFETIERPS